jgi:hypothetical protein
MGVELQPHPFLTSAPDTGEWLTSHLGCLTPGKEPQYILNRRLGGPQIKSWQFLEKQKISCSYWDSNLELSSP